MLLVVIAPAARAKARVCLVDLRPAARAGAVDLPRVKDRLVDMDLVELDMDLVEPDLDLVVMVLVARVKDRLDLVELDMDLVELDLDLVVMVLVALVAEKSPVAREDGVANPLVARANPLVAMALVAPDPLLGRAKVEDGAALARVNQPKEDLVMARARAPVRAVTAPQLPPPPPPQLPPQPPQPPPPPLPPPVTAPAPARAKM